MFHKLVMSAVSIEGYMICIAVLLESLAIFNAVKTALPVEVKLLQIWDFYVYFTKEARLSYLSPTDIRDADFSWLFCGQPSGSRPAKEKAHATRRECSLMRISSTDSRHDGIPKAFKIAISRNFTGASLGSLGPSVALPQQPLPAGYAMPAPMRLPQQPPPLQKSSRFKRLLQQLNECHEEETKLNEAKLG